MASRILAQAGPSNPSSLVSSTSKIITRPSPSSTRIKLNLSAARARSAFSTSARVSAPSSSGGTDAGKGETHYETLGIAPGSSRMEIKAAYFRLSKRYHPDVRRSKGEDGEATARFHEVSTAYSVLSDDRQRRAYDRTLISTAPSSSPLHRSRAYAPHTPGSSSSSTYAYEMHARRRRGATHAWEGPRGYTGRTHPQYAQGSSSAGAGAAAGRHYDPSSSSSSSPYASPSPFSHHSQQSSTASPSGQPPRREERLTGRLARAEEEHAAHDRIVRESNVGRFFRALGIVLVVSWVGGLGRSLGG